MNTLTLAVAGEFAGRLKDMMWTAYGPLIKWAAIIALIVVVVLPLLAFVKKLMR